MLQLIKLTNTTLIWLCHNPMVATGIVVIVLSLALVLVSKEEQEAY